VEVNNVDGESTKTEETKEDDKPTIDDDFIREYSSNTEVVRFIQSKFPRLSTTGSVHLIISLLRNEFPIHASSLMKKHKALYQYNMKKFDKERNLKKEEIKDLKMLLNAFLTEIGKEPIRYDKEQHKDFEVKEIDGEQFFILEKNILYKKIRKLVCDEKGNAFFKYNFKESDMEIMPPKNKDTLQRCLIQILGTSIKFEYPVEFVYSCPRCGSVTNMKAYRTASTNNRIDCPGIFSYVSPQGEPRSRRCEKGLIPDNDISITKDSYYYDICYEEATGRRNLKKMNAGAFSFKRYDPGFYECVLFRIKNPKKTELYQIMDVKEVLSNRFVFPPQDPSENYFFTLQRAVDEYIKEKTGMEIYGLFPMKVAILIQKMFDVIGLKLICNIQILGDASTGKSTVLKYYGFLLNAHLNQSTNGLSTSIPGLRGTKVTISLMGKDLKIITLGHLGTYKTIHIDEAGESKELVRHLKTFLLEDNYSYDKAGSDGTFQKRTAHINISENLDIEHLGQYRGSIKKAYKELNIKIGDEEMKEWDENWDLHLPIYKYNDNLYLRKVVADKRLEYKQKQTFWLDNYDYPLHERFPFYFYLVNKKKSAELFKIIRGNVARNTISENLELIRALKSDDINDFFETE